MKLFFIGIFTILIASNVYSQSPWCLKAGVNISSFTNEDSDFITSFTFGISREYPLNDSYSIIPEIFLTKQGGIVKDEPVKTPEYEEYLYSYDILSRVVYFEIPILFAGNFDFNSLRTKIYLGPSYRLGFIDASKISNEKLIYDRDNPEKKEEYENYDFEYIQGDYDNSLPRIISSGLGLNIGVMLKYSFLTLDIMYSYALHDIGQLDQFHPLNKNTHALHFLLGVNF